MARTAARIKQDDVRRVLRVVRDLGLGARVDLVNGVIDVLPKPIEMPASAVQDTPVYTKDFRM